MSKPLYFEYFTQGLCQFFETKWVLETDLSWIDALNQERLKIRRPGYGVTYFDSDEDTLSKDFDSIDFPLSHEWPTDFKEKYDNSAKESEGKLNSLIKTAKQTIEIEDLKLYIECEDGNHYFSTPFYANGDIAIAEIDGDSNFDSVDTAIFSFINDWNEWDEEHGKEYALAVELSQLEALRAPESTDTNASVCEHEDLGSLGYVHGDVVKCPYCKEIAEVW